MIFLIIALFGVIIFLNGCGSNTQELTILKDKTVLNQSICSSLEDYVFIYQTGCQHCEKVVPRLEQVEQELNITFKEYNLAVKEDRTHFDNLDILVRGVPAVIIHCKVMIGDQYSADDFKNAVNSG